MIAPRPSAIWPLRKLQSELMRPPKSMKRRPSLPTRVVSLVRVYIGSLLEKLTLSLT